MATLSRLQSLTNNTSLQNLIHRHLLRHVATPHPFNIFPESQPLIHFDSQNVKSCLAGHFSDNNKLNSNANEFVLNLRTFDLSMMELRGSRSSSSKNRPDLDEDIEDDDDDDFDDDDDDDVDDVYGSGSSDDDDDDNNGRRGGGSRVGGAYTV